MLDPQTVFVCAGTAAGTIATVIYAGRQAVRRWCPQCTAILPQFRLPRSVAEFRRRGWTCPRCSVHLDADGRMIGTPHLAVAN